jgi:hypothetical protein
MKERAPSSHQSGATLVIALIMLTLITVLVTNAFTMSVTDVQSVTNRQLRGEAIAAANKAIEQIVSSPFTSDPTGESIDVDIDNDARVDYRVDFAAPECVSANQLAGSGVPPSSVSLGSSFAVSATNHYQTMWDIDGTVFHPASGTSVRVRQGVRVLLTQAQFDDVCK